MNDPIGLDPNDPREKKRAFPERGQLYDSSVDEEPSLNDEEKDNAKILKRQVKGALEFTQQTWYDKQRGIKNDPDLLPEPEQIAVEGLAQNQSDSKMQIDEDALAKIQQWNPEDNLTKENLYTFMTFQEDLYMRIDKVLQWTAAEIGMMTPAHANDQHYTPEECLSLAADNALTKIHGG